MRTVLVALGLVMMSLPAYAEMQTTARTEEQQRADRDADRAYRAMRRQIADKPGNTDPWAGVRNLKPPRVTRTRIAKPPRTT